MSHKWPLPFTSRNNCISIESFKACCRNFPSHPHYSAQIIYYGYKLWHSSICNFLHPPSLLSYGHILSETPDFSDTLNFFHSSLELEAIHEISHPHRTKASLQLGISYTFDFHTGHKYNLLYWQGMNWEKEYVYLYLITTPSTQQCPRTRTALNVLQCGYLGPKKCTTNPLTKRCIKQLKLNIRVTTKLFLKHPESKFVTAKTRNGQTSCTHAHGWLVI
jgi:hypothetical protein